MYLAFTRKGGKLFYSLRRSFYSERNKCYSYQNVFDLGEHPQDFIQRFNDRCVFFDTALEQAVAEVEGGDPTPLLERLLFRFLPVEVQRVINDFQRWPHSPRRSLTAEEREEIAATVHIFDRRRMYSLRYGAVDQSRLYRLSEKLYRPLLAKCRDEREFFLAGLERDLPPAELKKYVFSVFNLQRYFSESFAATMPEALEEVKMAEVFEEELCSLNGQSSFWDDDVPGSSLHPHLQRYLFYFFDNAFRERSFAEDFFNQFRDTHRTFRWPEKKPDLTEEETIAIFGKNMEQLRTLNRRELTRLFRQKAKEHHPDGGGESENFVKLLETYELLKKKT